MAGQRPRCWLTDCIRRCERPDEVEELSPRHPSPSAWHRATRPANYTRPRHRHRVEHHGRPHPANIPHPRQRPLQQPTHRHVRHRGGITTTCPIRDLVHGRDILQGARLLPSAVRYQGGNRNDVCLVCVRVSSRQDGGRLHRDAGGSDRQVHGAGLQHQSDCRYHGLRACSDISEVTSTSKDASFI